MSGVVTRKRVIWRKDRSKGAILGRLPFTIQARIGVQVVASKLISNFKGDFMWRSSRKGYYITYKDLLGQARLITRAARSQGNH
jgi:hypothetical protein